MDKDKIINGVATEVEWWLKARAKKIASSGHSSMEVNPFMAPLIAALHGHENFNELSKFLIAGHFYIGHATGFGKLVDEKILPRVFGTTKLDSKFRKIELYKRHYFDNIDHIVKKDGEEVLLSLKASKWTIQLGQAVNLNNSFGEIMDSMDNGEHNHKKIVLAAFYGSSENLTDKYRIVRGINTGANHKVRDLQNYVEVLSGKEFWSWLGHDNNTQEFVIEGILKAIQNSKKDLEKSQSLLDKYQDTFQEKFSHHIKDGGIFDWKSFLKEINR